MLGLPYPRRLPAPTPGTCLYDGWRTSAPVPGNQAEPRPHVQGFVPRLAGWVMFT